MGFKGDKYTWWNKRYGTSGVMERLDRVLSLPDAAERLEIIEDKINKLLQDQEIYWKQRSRASWLKWGEQLQGQQSVLDSVEPLITAEANESLIKEFSASGIAHALYHIHPTKAPGPDGMPALSTRNTGIS
ncbi:hypothetical protein PanWU01x14_028850 [Parasponia andersonii]|uniref:Uncharacterized protein n=1 Tax=Parasponia andersonii TaxID=3476 RepID=A0A2P5DVD9_PARAD|nr:hypothetical protein PanWU01x14_028850 [Parasponia andersonii]